MDYNTALQIVQDINGAPISSETAINVIDTMNGNPSVTPMSTTMLQDLANRVDAGVGNATVLLYSGGVGEIDPNNNGLRQFGAKAIAEALANGTTVKTITDTEVGTFLNIRNLILLGFTHTTAIQQHHSITDASINPIRQILQHGGRHRCD